MKNYTFTVYLDRGNTTPEFNVMDGVETLPVNRMPMPLRNNDTITFAFEIGMNMVFDSCKFYCWPIGLNADAKTPFLIKSTSTTDQITFQEVAPPFDIIEGTKITIKFPSRSDSDSDRSPFSFWEFALAGLFRLTSPDSALIPFFVDPEAVCSSGS